MNFFEPIAAASLLKRRSTRLALRVALLSLALCACMPSQAKGLFGNDAKDKQAKAHAMWQERCKKAGVFIHRTVDEVEGIYVLKLRPEGINYGDQYKMDDPYGRDSLGKGYIESFLKGSYEANHRPSKSNPPPSNPAPIPKGYAYVEAIDPAEGQRYRYTGRVEEPWQTNKSYLKGYLRFVVDKQPALGPAPRYGLTYDDISTREERDHWIAGSSLKVIDLQTNEVIAERIGYMVDLGQGNNSGGRAPWLLATRSACPAFVSAYGTVWQVRQASKFVDQVLRPSKK